MTRSIIVAVADDGAIGIKGGLPWHISADLKYFKRVTMGAPVIMGRTTYESIGRPLPGRLNIVLTSRDIPGVACVRSLEAAFEAAGDVPECFVIGGASVYRAALESADKLYLTCIHTNIPEADAYFPEINSDIWALVSSTEPEKDPESGIEYEFRVYKRVSSR